MQLFFLPFDVFFFARLSAFLLRRGLIHENEALFKFKYNRPVLFNLFRYDAPLKMFWQIHAPHLLEHLNSCTLFTDTSPVSPT